LLVVRGRSCQYQETWLTKELIIVSKMCQNSSTSICSSKIFLDSLLLAIKGMGRKREGRRQGKGREGRGGRNGEEFRPHF
jgi:hypothetical protein